MFGKSGIRTHGIYLFIYRDLADLHFKPLSHLSETKILEIVIEYLT